jgi:iron complex outermembrane recepter protein
MTSSTRSSRTAVAVLGTLCCCAAWAPTFAADAQSPTEGKLEEIIVTAQKREQSIQDIGTSITAFDANALGKLGLTSATDIAQQVPALQYQAFSPTITIFNLRGVSQNDFGDHHEAPVAVYADDVYVASMGAVAGALYDLARVEVLRGPQGTLFGRNATGGLIHYVSERPSDKAGGFINVDGGRFGDIETEGAINVPLGDGVATRFSFSTAKHDGIIHNLVGKDANSANQYAARLQLLLKPSEAGEVLLKAYGVRNVGEVSPSYAWGASQPNAQGLGRFIGVNENAWGTCPGCDQSGYRNTSTDPFTQAFDRQGVFSRTVYGLTGHVNWKFGDVTFTSVTDYMHLKKRYGEDSDGSPNFQFNFDTYQTYHQFSQEFHVNGQKGPLRWIAGLYYLDLHNDDLQDEQVNQTFIGFVVSHQGPKFKLNTRSWAVFGQAEWDVTDQLTLIAGLRNTHDRKTYDFVLWTGDPSTPLTDANGAPFIYNPTTNPGQADRSYDAVSGKVELDFKPSHGSLYYASINRGTKGGGWSAPSNPPGTDLLSDFVQIVAYQPETLTDYEIGTKHTLLDGRARLNADVFYYDYKNYQAFILRNFTQIIGNRDAVLKGGEFELAILPAAGVTVQVGVSALDTRIKDVILPDGSAADRVMPNAPKWSLNALARYEWRAGSGRLSAQVDTKWSAKQYLENINAPVDLESSYAVTNLRFGYSSEQHWDITAWVRNVANKFYRVYNLDLSGLGYDESVYGPPRWYGVTFAYHWGT